MGKTKTKTKAKAEIQIPQNQDEANDYLSRLGAAQRQVEAIEANATQRIDDIKAEAESLAKPHQAEIKTLFKGLQIYAEARRAELTDNGKRKFIRMAAGELLWRLNPSAVKLAKGHTLEILKTNLQLLKLEQFLRRKVEVNKEAMLDDPELAKTVPGVLIVQDEEFIAKPTEIKVEEPV